MSQTERWVSVTAWDGRAMTETDTWLKASPDCEPVKVRAPSAARLMVPERPSCSGMMKDHPLPSSSVIDTARVPSSQAVLA